MVCYTVQLSFSRYLYRYEYKRDAECSSIAPKIGNKKRFPYSATEIGADGLAESFYRSFQVPVVIVRSFNTYGPRQSARASNPNNYYIAT